MDNISSFSEKLVELIYDKWPWAFILSLNSFIIYKYVLPTHNLMKEALDQARLNLIQQKLENDEMRRLSKSLEISYSELKNQYTTLAVENRRLSQILEQFMRETQAKGHDISKVLSEIEFLKDEIILIGETLSMQPALPAPKEGGTD